MRDTMVERFHAGLISYAKMKKETIVQSEGIGSDLHPLIIATNGPVYMAAYCHDRAAMLTVIEVVGGSLMPPFMCLITESYTATWDKWKDSPPPWKGWSGNLEGAFAQGIEGVQEAIAVHSFTPSRSVMEALPYKYGVGRVVEWLPAKAPMHVDHHDPNLAGVIAETIRVAYGENNQHRKIWPARLTDEERWVATMTAMQGSGIPVDVMLVGAGPPPDSAHVVDPRNN